MIAPVPCRILLTFGLFSVLARLGPWIGATPERAKRYDSVHHSRDAGRWVFFRAIDQRGSTVPILRPLESRNMSRPPIPSSTVPIRRPLVSRITSLLPMPGSTVPVRRPLALRRISRSPIPGSIVPVRRLSFPKTHRVGFFRFEHLKPFGSCWKLLLCRRCRRGGQCRGRWNTVSRAPRRVRRTHDERMLS